MAANLTPKQWAAIAELLRLSNSKAALAARRVLVDGMEIGDAAKAVGMPYKDAHAAVNRVKNGMQLARAAVGINH